MQYTPKEYEFLGKQVAQGHFVRRSVSILSIIIALGVGLAGGYFLRGGPTAEPTKRPLAAENSQSNTLNRQNFDSVIQYEDMVRKNPSDINAWVMLGNTYYDLHDFAKAIDAYNTALQLDSKMPDVLVDCGVAYKMTGKPEMAIAYFDRALSISPQHKNAYFNKGVVLHNDLQKDTEAMDVWKRLVEIAPDFRTPEGRLLSDVLKAHETN